MTLTNFWAKIYTKLKIQRNKPNTQRYFHPVDSCCKPDPLFPVALQGMGNRRHIIPGQTQDVVPDKAPHTSTCRRVSKRL